MNTYYVNDSNFFNSEVYQKYLMEHPGTGSVRVRAYAAGEAIPISGLKVVVSKEIGGNNVIFFDGYTNESGVTEKIILPAHKLPKSDEDIPEKEEYKITITYIPDDISKEYIINIYDGVCVAQNINVVPKMMLEGGL